MLTLLIHFPISLFRTIVSPITNTRVGDIWSNFGGKMGNALKITFGGFKSEFWNTLVRWAWELPQTLVGIGYSSLCNIIGQVESVHYWGGATVIKTKGDRLPFGGIGVALGSYFLGYNTIEPNPENQLFQHEYGHYLQSKASGWFYLSRYGIPSAFSKGPHWKSPVEQDANIRAFQYFSKHDPGFNWVDDNGTQKTRWRPDHNPIIGYNWNLSHTDPYNQQVMRNGRLGLAWYDFLMSPFNFTIVGILFPGIVNTLLLNKKY
jgi:hypothetical protein